MNIRWCSTILTAVLVTATAGIAESGLPSPFGNAAPPASKEHSPTSTSPRDSPYHRHPPTGPLPVTIDPAKFEDNRRAYVAYSIAAQIKELLYQEPCFCHCRKFEGHKSLLDCYTSG